MKEPSHCSDANPEIAQNGADANDARQRHDDDGRHEKNDHFTQKRNMNQGIFRDLETTRYRGGLPATVTGTVLLSRRSWSPRSSAP